MTHIGNAIGVWLYRTLRGRGQGRHVLLLTVPGRVTGRPHTVPIRYYPRDGDFVVVGSNSGKPMEPQWMRNLRFADAAEIQVRERTLAVKPRITSGEERDALWHDVVLPEVPGMTRYQRKARRVLPIAVLHPVDMT